MKPEQAKELLAQIAKVTEKAFRDCGGIDPVFHFEGDDGFTSMIIPGEYSPEVKDQASFVIRRMLKVQNAKWVMMVSEAWTVRTLNGPPDGNESLEHHPDRREVIYYRLEDVDVQQMEAEQEIIRPDGQAAYLGELIIKEPMRTPTGRFVGLLPQGKMAS